jgi:hypothetical protein
MNIQYPNCCPSHSFRPEYLVTAPPSDPVTAAFVNARLCCPLIVPVYTVGTNVLFQLEGKFRKLIYLMNFFFCSFLAVQSLSGLNFLVKKLSHFCRNMMKQMELSPKQSAFLQGSIYWKIPPPRGEISTVGEKI